MFDFDMLDEEVKGQQGPRQPPQPKPAEEEQRSRHGVSGSRPSDFPDWDAPAPAGWWRVVHRPCCWAREAPWMDAPVVGVYRAGKVLAMKSLRMDQNWLLLRDECDGRNGNVQQWMRIDGTYLGLGVLLESLPTGCCPPSADVRDEHARVVEEALEQQRRWTKSELLGIS